MDEDGKLDKFDATLLMKIAVGSTLSIPESYNSTLISAGYAREVLRCALNYDRENLYSSIEEYEDEDDKVQTYNGAEMFDAYKSDFPVEINKGDKVTFRIYIYNNGNTDATDVTIKDTTR